MAEYSGLYNATDNVPEYTAADLGKFFNLLASGVAYGYENQLEVLQGTGLQVKVDSGGLVSKGWFYIQDEAADGVSPKTLSLDAATAGYVRKDYIVVEIDMDNATGVAKVVKGTEAVSDPAVPALTETGTKWQVALAVANISGSVISSIEDKRSIGSSRVNPEFSEDLTAPNITTGTVDAAEAILNNATIEDDGRLYLNTAKSAYIRYTSNALYLKLPSCDEVQVAMVVVGTSSSAPTGTYPVNTMYLERDA